LDYLLDLNSSVLMDIYAL